MGFGAPAAQIRKTAPCLAWLWRRARVEAVIDHYPPKNLHIVFGQKVTSLCRFINLSDRLP
jgi:hypothetical protein